MPKEGQRFQKKQIIQREKQGEMLLSILGKTFHQIAEPYADSVLRI